MKFKMKIKLSALLSALLLLISFNAYSQSINEGDKLDKIVAVVGDEIITLTEVEGALALLSQQNPTMNPRDPEVRKMVLESIIDKKLIITKAIEDTVEVSEEEVDFRLDNIIQMNIRQLGSEKRVEDKYGMSISRIKYELREEVKKDLMVETLQRQKFASMTVSPKEVSEFYKIYRDSLPPIPAQAEIYHIVKKVIAENSAKIETFEIAKSIRDSLLKGGNFADFAKNYSDDPYTKDSGGELGWFDKGKLYPEFERAAFALQKDEISLPVETPFGFHLIQTIDKKKDAVNTRHILFKIGQTSEDVDKVKKELADLKKQILEGADFEELAKKYSDDKETKGFGGKIGNMAIDELPESIKDLPDGSVSDPLIYKSDPGNTSYHIIYKKKTIPSHLPMLEDDYKHLESYALYQKQQLELAKYINTLRQELYWEIKGFE